jgi:hypothetical protein
VCLLSVPGEGGGHHNVYGKKWAWLFFFPRSLCVYSRKMPLSDFIIFFASRLWSEEKLCYIQLTNDARVFTNLANDDDDDGERARSTQNNNHSNYNFIYRFQVQSLAQEGIKNPNLVLNLNSSRAGFLLILQCDFCVCVLSWREHNNNNVIEWKVVSNRKYQSKREKNCWKCSQSHCTCTQSHEIRCLLS